MNLRNVLAAIAILCTAALWARAETAVTLSDVHLCCGACVRNANAAVTGAGAKSVAEQNARTVAITAPDAATAQKAVDALVLAGYFGKSSDASIKVAAPSGASDGKVQKLDVAGVHLCCRQCVTVVKEVLAKVPGVTGNTVVQRAPSFSVTGEFDAKVLFDELNKAGLAGKVAPAAATTAPAGG